MADHRPLTHPP